jgi:RNA polymerase sigma-70 factor (ECF subfamily)
MQSQRQIDRLFATFCRTGDPQALGAVFDETAGELLHLAGWLCGNRADAEDLLQHTFVQAVELRSQFEVGRPVVPWLVGLLGNLAKHLQRERAQRQVPARAGSPELDPATVAADAEFARTVKERVAGIEARYREVLELHLQAGLNSKEIAAKLGRPAGTVRTQMVRALAMLRKRLPAGFVAGIVPGVPRAAELARVKAGVMAKAAVHAPAGATAAGVITIAGMSGGMLTMKKLLVAIPALLLFSASATLLSPSAIPASPSAGVPEAARGDLAPAQPTDIAAAPSTSLSPTRTRVAPADADEVDPGFASLRVRVHWQDDGSPAAAVGVRAFVSHWDNRQSDAVTDAQGNCTLRHLRPGSWRVESSHADAVTAVDLAADAQGSLELVAKRTATIRGTVVDIAGIPVDDAQIWMSGLGDEYLFTFEVARSDRNGRFSVVVADKQMIGARKGGQVHSLARHVEAKSGDADITLSLRGADGVVHGKVFDDAGVPLRWVRVRVGEEILLRVSSPFEPPQSEIAEPAITAADGSFTVTGVANGWAAVSAFADGYAPYLEGAEVIAGATKVVEIHLHPAATAFGVVHGAHGELLAGVVVMADGPRELMTRRPSVRTNPDGSFLLANLPHGDLTLTVYTLQEQGERLHATMQCRLGAGDHFEWNPTLLPGHSIRGVVLDADGTPMAGVGVGCYAPPWCNPQRYEHTDARGSFALTDTGDVPVTVEVGEISQEPLRQVLGVAPDASDLEIRISHADLPSATLTGRFVDGAGNPIEADVHICNQGGIVRIKDVKTDANGTFVLGPLRPGVRELHVRTRSLGCVPLDAADLGADEHRDLGTIRVPAPGRVTFHVVNSKGEPVASGSIYVGARVLRREQPHYGFATIENGRAIVEAMPPGKWRVITNCSGPADIEVQSGLTTHVELGPPESR